MADYILATLIILLGLSSGFIGYMNVLMGGPERVLYAGLGITMAGIIYWLYLFGVIG